MALTLALSLMGNLVVALFVLICVTLILIILLQKGRGGGLGAAFGGGGAGSLLGTKTGDFLTWVTITLVAGFLVLAVLMGKFMRPESLSADLGAPTAVPAETPATDESASADIATPAADEATDTTAEMAGGAAEEATQPTAVTAEEPVEQPAGDAAPESSN